MFRFDEIQAVLDSDRNCAKNLLGVAVNHDTIQKWHQSPLRAKFMEEIRLDAETYRTEPHVPMTFSQFQVLLRSAEYDVGHYYSASRRRLMSLAMAALLYETDVYISALEDVLWAICDEYSWCLPYHLEKNWDKAAKAVFPPEQSVDLFAADTALALAETLYLLNDRLNPWVAARIRSEVERRIFKPMFDNAHYFRWQAKSNNWVAVCSGCVGMTALLMERDTNRLSGMIDKVIRGMETFLSGYGEDGGCHEGVGYWDYGFGHYVYFADMLYAYTDGKLDLFESPKVKAIARFPIAACLTYPQFVRYSDYIRDRGVSPGLMCRLHKRLQTPVLGELELLSFPHQPLFRWATNARNLFWIEDGLEGSHVPDGTYALSDMGWVIARRTYDSKTVAFTARGGHNGESHNHNDLGHFMIHVAGDSLLTDLGAAPYDGEYFGSNRYKILNTSSEGHSVPVINGSYQQAGEVYSANILQTNTMENGFVFGLDLTQAYPMEAGLTQFHRVFEWEWDCQFPQAKLLVTDHFRFVQLPEALDEVFISLHEPECADGQIVWAGSDTMLTLFYDKSAFQCKIERLQAKSSIGEAMIVYRTCLQASALFLRQEMRCTFQFVCRLL